MRFETGSGDEAYGEFEDLQTGEVFGSARSAGGTRGRDHLEESEDSDAESEDNDEIDAKLRALNAEKKAKSYISKAQKEDEDVRCIRTFHFLPGGVCKI